MRAPDECQTLRTARDIYFYGDSLDAVVCLRRLKRSALSLVGFSSGKPDPDLSPLSRTMKTHSRRFSAVFHLSVADIPIFPLPSQLKESAQFSVALAPPSPTTDAELRLLILDFVQGIQAPSVSVPRPEDNRS